MTERVLNPVADANLYDRFEAIASILTAYSPHNAIYMVEVVYLDYDQDWKWTMNNIQSWCPIREMEV